MLEGHIKLRYGSAVCYHMPARQFDAERIMLPPAIVDEHGRQPANLDLVEFPPPLPWQDFPEMEQLDPEAMDQTDRIREGRGRFSIIMYYPDGSNTEVSQKPRPPSHYSC